MTQPADARKRWDTDERYGGVADASAFAAEIAELASRRDIRRQAWALVGAIAETMASVREHRAGGQVILDVVTGEPDSATAFASHGHTVRLIMQPQVTEPPS